MTTNSCETQFRRADPADWESALALQFSVMRNNDRGDFLNDLMRSAQAGMFDLSQLWIAEREHQLAAVMLTTFTPDRVLNIWPPVAAAMPEGAAEVSSSLLSHVLEQANGLDLQWVQCLVDPTEDWNESPLREQGFLQANEIQLLARLLTDLPPRDPLPQATWQIYDEHRTRQAFAQAIEATYQDSLDVPQLVGIRTGDDALSSHMLSGQFIPEWCRLYSLQQQPAAVIILGDHAHQDSVELVYMGVVPAFRGRGLGRWLIVEGLHLAAAQGRQLMYLAVDHTNTFANTIYHELGFARWGVRRLWIWRPPARGTPVIHKL